ncbi:MAG: outer membrane protein assembly factor BamA, partial [Piscirickettsiaceae bacterium]|nr:outer membrane protein assembly factor BamA [Piscirickettsiaceae bacterium]
MKKLFSFIVLLLVTNGALAYNFTIKAIEINGLKHISSGRALNFLSIDTGDEISDKGEKDIIRSLYASKLFNNVRIKRKGDVLIITVVENPIVSVVKFVGNKAVKSKDLIAMLVHYGTTTGQPLVSSALKSGQLEIQRQYFEHGMYGCTIESDVTISSKDNSASVRITVTQGVTAKLTMINIVGNEIFKESKLLNSFKSIYIKSRLLMRLLFIGRSDKHNYSRTKLLNDLKILSAFYLDQGYADFVIESTQISVSIDFQQIFITINIFEGLCYEIMGVELIGDSIIPEDELFRLITIRSGSVFSGGEVKKSLKSLTNALSSYGYIFAKINVVPRIKRDILQVSLIFIIDFGRRVYVQRISIVGHTATRDEVLRRELRQAESYWISLDRLNRSLVNIKRLGYFKKVKIDTIAVADEDDLINLHFNIAEHRAGNVKADLGWEKDIGIILKTKVLHKNFLGSGKHIKFAFNNGRVNRLYSFGYINPILKRYGISHGFGIFYRGGNLSGANIASYVTNSIGGSVNAGAPIATYERVSLAIGYVNVQIGVRDKINKEPDKGLHERSNDKSYSESFHDASVYPSGFVDVKQLFAKKITSYKRFMSSEGASFNIVNFTFTWSYDSRNNIILPTLGMLQKVTAKLIPFGPLPYYKLGYAYNWYKPLSKRFVLALSGRLGYLGAAGAHTVPFFESFYAGGINSVRGYPQNSLGPVESYRKNDFKLVNDGNLLWNSIRSFKNMVELQETVIELQGPKDRRKAFNHLSLFNNELELRKLIKDEQAREARKLLWDRFMKSFDWHISTDKKLSFNHLLLFNNEFELRKLFKNQQVLKGEELSWNNIFLFDTVLELHKLFKNKHELRYGRLAWNNISVVSAGLELQKLFKNQQALKGRRLLWDDVSLKHMGITVLKLQQLFKNSQAWKAEKLLWDDVSIKYMGILQKLFKNRQALREGRLLLDEISPPKSIVELCKLFKNARTSKDRKLVWNKILPLKNIVELQKLVKNRQALRDERLLSDGISPLSNMVELRKLFKNARTWKDRKLV